ncbi:hypothetical protein K1719_020722 [Acacia pycnantha]|nr:hypothetical protein K1719_020722 [Acacia pycnantha]
MIMEEDLNTCNGLEMLELLVNNDDDFYTNPVVKDYYKNHVKSVLTRINTVTGTAYKDEPPIMAWELMNESRCQVDPQATPSLLFKHLQFGSKGRHFWWRLGLEASRLRHMNFYDDGYVLSHDASTCSVITQQSNQMAALEHSSSFS